VVSAELMEPQMGAEQIPKTRLRPRPASLGLARSRR